jgi:hypothetical protein
MSSNLSQYFARSISLQRSILGAACGPPANARQHKNQISNIRSGGIQQHVPSPKKPNVLSKAVTKSHIRTLIGDFLGTQKDLAECPAFPNRDQEGPFLAPYGGN